MRLLPTGKIRVRGMRHHSEAPSRPQVAAACGASFISGLRPTRPRVIFREVASEGAAAEATGRRAWVGPGDSAKGLRHRSRDSG